MAAITFEIEFILKLEVYSILFIECISKVFICFPLYLERYIIYLIHKLKALAFIMVCCDFLLINIF